MQTDARSWETHSLIASDRVEGTPVRGTDGAQHLAAMPKRNAEVR